DLRPLPFRDRARGRPRDRPAGRPGAGDGIHSASPDPRGARPARNLLRGLSLALALAAGGTAAAQDYPIEPPGRSDEDERLPPRIGRASGREGVELSGVVVACTV